MKKLLIAGAIAGAFFMTVQSAKADGLSFSSHGLRADSHAPIGVMQDHMHKKGEWMVSYRFARMHMDGSRNGTNNLTPEEIATTVPNRFAGTPGQPPTLRVVPTEMTTQMHMVGAMYAPTDDLTLMVMGSYIDRKMDHVTFQGGAGTTELGRFTTVSQGLGDTTAAALIKLYKDDIHHVHLNAGLSLPTGSISEEDGVLAPNGMTPTLRLPYAMQLGSGTYDAMPGITYTGISNRYGWGAQYMGTLRLGRNSSDYSLGDKHMITAWGSYLFNNAFSGSLRVTGETEDSIDGIDAQIVAPVQTADPDNFGGERVSLSLGMNAVVPSGSLKGHRFSAEVTMPIYQDLNGPQLERDTSFILGWSKSF